MAEASDEDCNEDLKKRFKYAHEVLTQKEGVAQNVKSSNQ